MHKTQNIRKLNEFVVQSILSVISSREETGTITLLPNIYLSANYQSIVVQNFYNILINHTLTEEWLISSAAVNPTPILNIS